ncbi:aminotransferase class I/II-fold pyridoxal phosphate-dependent enzyme [Bifidobacterium sp. SMB2]|uniref:Aminotransferase class I/II-fold pyridoxal phosphate-dependent enzyme n=1 Tax=Bifidobacterium saimiriisciurei TaxID=2661627 RepID=A0ABX0CEL2_9BIFI|nr:MULTISPECIES: PLP-dependent aminotransferase family protein [Bifidobacterium]NEG96340.1 aminotransferase class I/II-fold pyridoxal phosphate-dependent enzyme [Bifidobacterium sp. SMB2]NEH11028.1 aminotransferase class I/II-fold pyridoxal phosphate-dependent enzyme [Bifidobacterium saimiriisciurei]
MARSAPLVIDWKPDRASGVPITEQIVQYMCAQVSGGAWPIGSRLPSQRALAEGFGVNRSTVIAAINELADYGIVEGLHGAGTRIVSNTWSLMLPGAPDWADYVSSGFFKANNTTIQAINRLEFDPSMARLGTGELDPRLFPRDMWHDVLTEAASEIDSMGYPEPEGIPELREAIAAHMRESGIKTGPEQILVTSGALQALQIISMSLLSTGSTVFAEAPSYIKSLQVFQSAGMHLAGVPMDANGIDVTALSHILAGGTATSAATAATASAAAPTSTPAHPAPSRRSGRNGRGSVLYTIPTNHNPTGVTMSEARRRELLECCVANRLPIIEDGAYQDLVFDDSPTRSQSPVPLKSMDETGMVIYLGSASKALAPGLRIGWIVAPEPIVHRLADVKMQMDYGASLLSQWVFARFLTSGRYGMFLAELNKELRRRRDAALATLDRLFDGIAHWNTPGGGFYIWLTFDEPMPMGRLFQKAVEAGVLLNPGDIYDFEGDNSLRLSYAYTTPAEFADAAERLAAVVRALG